MPVSPDCILCLCRQSLEAARYATEDPAIHEKVLRRSLELALERGFTEIPPFLAQDIQREIRQLTGNPDPYSVEKKRFNDLLLSQYDQLRDMVRSSQNPLETAVRIAIGGNSIDFALGTNLNAEIVNNALQAALTQPLKGDLELFTKYVSGAKNILYITDNCGEVVCDRLLMEEILRQFQTRITAVVRGAPVINDATLEDAKSIGLTELVPVIDNGNDGVGTILELCSEEFHAHLRDSDFVIAKGLANYETLVEYGPDKLSKPIAYLFKAKCAFIAQYTQTQLGDHVVMVDER